RPGSYYNKTILFRSSPLEIVQRSLDGTPEMAPTISIKVTTQVVRFTVQGSWFRINQQRRNGSTDRAEVFEHIIMLKFVQRCLFFKLFGLQGFSNLEP
ncbi:MAG: hypothetical protein M0R70_16030, partial [Nitrospirae bacterium]|nr:hypothetical protein [Nitrospirota bacterium]